MKNKVELIGWYGGDKAIARSAWTSTQIDIESKSDNQIRDLIVNKLWNNESGKPHKTPFERGIVEFSITCDQASHIHLLKHRLANINGESARYKELKDDKFYLPDDWRNIQVKSSIEKFGFTVRGQNHYDLDAQTWAEVLEDYTELGNLLYHISLSELEKPLGRKRAKESARFFKTINSQLTLSVMMNMSCFYNFYSLRADSEAQLEIQIIATDMLNCIKSIEGNPFKYTIEAFGI